MKYAKMPHVIINVNTLGSSMTGIQRYVYEIIGRLDRLCDDAGIVLELVHARDVVPNLPHLEHTLISSVDANGASIGYSMKLSQYAKSQGALLCSMSGGPLLSSGVVSMHDLRTLTKPRFDSFGFRAKRNAFYRLNRYLAKRVVTLSKFSKREIVQKLHIADDQIEIIGCGWEHFASISPDVNILTKWGLSHEGYYYTLGSRAPHKNLRWVYEVASRNPSETFVITGKEWNDRQKDIPAATPNIIHTGYISDEESKALMCGCKAFLYPSLYDGFGIPPLEAASCGTRLILSSAACLPEIYGGVAQFIDPYDYDVNLSSLLVQPLSNSFDTLLSNHSWQKSAAKWRDLLLELSTMS